MTEKRNRSLNWDEEERQLLRTVLKEYAPVIENKALDANASKLKSKAWQELHKKFNELNSKRRELNQVQSQWKTMKMAARKALTNHKKETQKTGGGPPPASPEQEVVEIKDLLHPAELLKDHNIWDSDGIDIGVYEMETITIQESQPLGSVDISLETPYVATTKKTPTASGSHSSSAKPELPPSEGFMVTPIKNSVSTIAAKMAPKRKLLSNNVPIMDHGSKSKRCHDDYVSKMIAHSKLLKDEDHIKQQERADEEHQIKMAIHNENLKAAILQREILEIRKTREQNLCMQPPTFPLI